MRRGAMRHLLHGSNSSEATTLVHLYALHSQPLLSVTPRPSHLTLFVLVMGLSYYQRRRKKRKCVMEMGKKKEI